MPLPTAIPVMPLSFTPERDPALYRISLQRNLQGPLRERLVELPSERSALAAYFDGLCDTYERTKQPPYEPESLQNAVWDVLQLRFEALKLTDYSDSLFPIRLQALFSALDASLSIEAEARHFERTDGIFREALAYPWTVMPTGMLARNLGRISIGHGQS